MERSHLVEQLTRLGLTSYEARAYVALTGRDSFTAAQVAQIESLVTQASQHYAAAYAALKAGDLTTFSNEMQIVGQLLQQLQQITGTVPTKTSPSPTPRTSPTPSK